MPGLHYGHIATGEDWDPRDYKEIKEVIWDLFMSYKFQPLYIGLWPDILSDVTEQFSLNKYWGFSIRYLQLICM